MWCRLLATILVIQNLRERNEVAPNMVPVRELLIGELAQLVLGTTYGIVNSWRAVLYWMVIVACSHRRPYQMDPILERKVPVMLSTTRPVAVLLRLWVNLFQHLKAHLVRVRLQGSPTK